MTSETLKNLISHRLAELGLGDTEVSVSLPDPRFGDFSTNVALKLAKQKGLPPHELAQSLSNKLMEQDDEGVFEKIVPAGGFINFTLSQKYLVGILAEVTGQADRYGITDAGQGRKVMVEYFQNNVAKPPHVGHLRSAVIGDSLLRILRYLNFQAVSDTHIGDWGTQFGILLYAYKTMGDRLAIEKDPVNELNKLYVEMSAKMEAFPELREKGKEEFAKLEKGDRANRELWEWFVKVSMADFERYRKLLGILPFDNSLGESFYEDKMGAVLTELKDKGLLKESQGAQIVDLSGGDGGKNLGIAVLVKSDGATTYLLRDLATIKYRLSEFGLKEMLYVVDNRQSHHFEQVFEISKRLGYLTEEIKYQHVDFGFLSLPEGPISTRKGNTVSLQNLIDEAEKRAIKIIEEKNPGLKNKEAVAKLVALAAIKYFDLSHNRKTEIVFNWDQALSFEGNTGPYLQYTHARIFGILRKFGKIHVPTDPILQESLGFGESGFAMNEHEQAVVRKINQFPFVLQQVAQDFYPNLLCNYLFELSQCFNSFYEEVPVIKETNEHLRAFRFNLITATAQVIKNGLNLLGIEAPEEM